MEFPVTAGAAASTHASTEAHASSMLRTLLLCDLVDSTALVERLGDLLAAELIRKHDRLARTLADRHGGREIDKTDGFMMMFERPVQAVAFALDYQRGLRQLNAAESTSSVGAGRYPCR
jgi:class 3 adenylate cyclase